MKILLAVDGSKNSLDAVDCVIEHADWYRSKPEIELVYVHLPVPKLPRMKLAVGKSQIQRYYQEEGDARLAAARRRLDAAGIKHKATVLVGAVAETIVKRARAAGVSCKEDYALCDRPYEAIIKAARKHGCDLIFMASHGRRGVAALLLGSETNKVLTHSKIPVLVTR